MIRMNVRMKGCMAGRGGEWCGIMWHFRQLAATQGTLSLVAPIFMHSHIQGVVLLTAGEKGMGKSGKKLTFEGSIFHR